MNDDIRQEFEAVIAAAHRISAEVGEEVEQLLRDGQNNPLSHDEAATLLKQVVMVLKTNAERRGDTATASILSGDIEQIVADVLEARDRIIQNGQVHQPTKKLQLVKHNGIEPEAVHPTPWFHGIKVAMNAGFVKTTDIALWAGNDRLDIHINQFKQRHDGREPTKDELLDIMLSKMQLPGIAADDQFKIVDLARSIAVNGVRKPPILDVDGTLLDGNRRLAACYYILNSSDFDSEQKKRVEYVYVWQLTEHATEADRNAVVISLNFESDCKIDWPEYVKARRVFEEWQAMLALEPRRPAPQDLAKMKRQLSTKYALGPDTTVVNRYLKMVEWADEFEDYHIGEKSRDKYEVKHQANRYFQYFDELSKGNTAGGVAYTLNQDEPYKHLVYDLLFQGKFRNWNLIRLLKYVDQNVLDALRLARDTPDIDDAQEIVEDGLHDAHNRRRENRVGNPNTRIEVFVKWLEDLPLSSLRRDVTEENKTHLRDALRLVEKVFSYDGDADKEE